MGFFGSGAKQTTTVSPSSEVDQLLRNVVSRMQGMNPGEYINRQLAGFNQNQQNALQNMVNSPQLQQLQNLYSPLTEQGLGQLNQIGSQLQNLGNQQVGAGDVKNFQGALTGSPLAQKTGKAAANVSLGGGTPSGSLRRAALTGANNQQAISNLGRQQNASNMGISNLMGNNAFQRGVLGNQANIASQNVGMGALGTQAGQQAIMNQLRAGDIQQSQGQRQADLDWQNQIGRQQFGWNDLNNRLNILNQVSPMAGYTTTNSQAAPSQWQQILQAGMSGIGAYGKMGGFSPEGIDWSGQGLQNRLNDYFNPQGMRR